MIRLPGQSGHRACNACGFKANPYPGTKKNRGILRKTGAETGAENIYTTLYGHLEVY